MNRESIKAAIEFLQQPLKRMMLENLTLIREPFYQTNNNDELRKRLDSGIMAQHMTMMNNMNNPALWAVANGLVKTSVPASQSPIVETKPPTLAEFSKFVKKVKRKQRRLDEIGYSLKKVDWRKIERVVGIASSITGLIGFFAWLFSK